MATVAYWAKTHLAGPRWWRLDRPVTSARLERAHCTVTAQSAASAGSMVSSLVLHRSSSDDKVFT
jgi:hypothetical protein